MHRLALLALFSPLLLSADTANAIDFNQHGWYVYSGDHRIAGRWGLHFDGQWRRSDLITRWQQYQVRPGVNFSLNRNVLLTAGYAYTRTYPYGDYPVLAAIPEHRIYEQVVIRHPRKHASFSQRYRLEQRFIRYPNSLDSKWTYQNRFRYMFRTEIPLNRKADAAIKWYLPVWNEVLIGIPPNYGARPFDQNRLFGGVGRSLGRAGNIEVGYMNQLLAQRNGRIFEFNNTLFVAFTSTYDLSGMWR